MKTLIPTKREAPVRAYMKGLVAHLQELDVRLAVLSNEPFDERTLETRRLYHFYNNQFRRIHGKDYQEVRGK